jgi:predicted exporter
VTSVVFGRVHLITLVFGAALVGVAEDYGIHYFASRQKHHLVGARETLQSLLPALLMALVTTVAGYGVLGLAPFPGLRQMAVFSSVGVAAAFATVAAWFPVFDRGVVPMSRLSRWWSTTRARIPRLSAHQAVVLCGVLGSLGVGSLAFGRVDDDIRGLATSDATLMATQQRVATIVGLPSPAQFLVVRGSTQAEILEREERVTLALEPMVASGNLKGFQAISTWVPSPSTQAANARLFQRARHVALTAASELLEESNVDDPPALGPLTVEAFFHLPFSSPFRALFSEGASVVLLDSPRREAFQQLEQLSALPGVTFVDKTAAMSALLGQWRLRMAQLLIIGFAATFLILAWRFGRRAMRAFAPTVVASLGAIAVTVLLGEPITLFHVLATWILLGIGVDYGIFLLEHPSENAGEAWLAVGLGAVSTLLSFGLLSLSRTFALHAFGQTIGIGLVLVWVLSPLVVDARSESRGEAH